MLLACAVVGSAPAEVLSGTIAGWRRQGPVSVYGPDDLYGWIDGAAEVYRSLNVRRVESARYHRDDLGEALVDVFDMGSSQDAYGAYHHDIRQGNPAGVGEESERDGTNVAFWKGRQFVSVVGLVAGRAMEEGVVGLARAVAEQIPGPSEPPEILAWLPEQDLVRSQIHYFHDSLLLRTHLDVGEGNPLGLSMAAEGLVARYAGPPGDDMVLLLVRYPQTELSERALSRLAGSTNVLDCLVRGPVLIALFGEGDRSLASERARSTAERIAP